MSVRKGPAALVVAFVAAAGTAAAAPQDAAAPAKPAKATKPATAKAVPSKSPRKKPAAKAEPKPAVEPEIEMNDPVPAAPVVAPMAEPAGAKADVSATVEVAPVHDLAEPHTRHIYFRAGFARIMPLSSSRELELADVNGPASLAVQNGPIVGSGASVESTNALAAVVGYRLGNSGKWSLETVLGLPFTVKFRATGTLANMSLAPTALGLQTGVQPLGPDLGEASAAPPMVTLVYQPVQLGRVTPFVGLGAAVLFAFNAHVTNPTLIAVSQPEMSISPAPGVVLQGGFEARITNRIYARLDVKFIAGMLARAEVRHIQIATPDLPLFSTVEVGTAKMSVWVNPLVVQAGLGTDF